MEDVLRYLKLKNHFYEKFYSLTARFMEQVNKNQWEDMELFLDNRDRILNIIRSFDHKIASHFQELDLAPDELEKYRRQVKGLLDIREEIGKKIVAMDLELISIMEDVKTETIRELKQKQETNQHLNAFTPTKRPVKPRKDA